jgi:hypothetical protein
MFSMVLLMISIQIGKIVTIIISFYITGKKWSHIYNVKFKFDF